MGPVHGYLGTDCSLLDEKQALDPKLFKEKKKGSQLKPFISQGRKPGVFLHVKKLGFKV